MVKNDKQLSMTLKTLGIQAGELIKLCHMDETVLRETAHKHGMDSRILQIVVAASCSDIPVIPLIIQRKTTGVTMDAKTAAVLYALAQPNTPKSLRYAIKKCVLHFSSVRGITGDDAISAHVVDDAIVAMTRGIVDRIVDIAAMNKKGAFVSTKTGNDATHFFELIRTKNPIRMEYEYVQDLIEIGNKTMGINRPIMKALCDISINIIPHNKGNGDKKPLAIKSFADEDVANIHTTMIRLLVAAANYDGNTLRVVGPGSNLFQSFLIEKHFIREEDDETEILQQKLSILLACAWGTKIDLYKLSRRFAIQTPRCIAMAHLISEECGDGNFRLGLGIDKTFSHMLIPTKN